MKSQELAEPTVVSEPTQVEAQSKSAEWLGKAAAMALFGASVICFANATQFHEESVRAGNTAEVLEFNGSGLADVFRAVEDDRGDARNLYLLAGGGVATLGAGASALYLASIRRRDDSLKLTCR